MYPSYTWIDIFKLLFILLPCIKYSKMETTSRKVPTTSLIKGFTKSMASSFPYMEERRMAPHPPHCICGCLWNRKCPVSLVLKLSKIDLVFNEIHQLMATWRRRSQNLSWPLKSTTSDHIFSGDIIIPTCNIINASNKLYVSIY